MNEAMVSRPLSLLLLPKSNLLDLHQSRHCLPNSCQNTLRTECTPQHYGANNAQAENMPFIWHSLVNTKASSQLPVYLKKLPQTL